MIKYSLRCEHDHVFEGWFRNNDDCEMQTRDGHVECPFCASTKISKSLMAPRVTGTRTQDSAVRPSEGQGAAEVAPSPAVPQPATSNAVVPHAGAAVAAPQEGPDPQQVQKMLRAFREHVVKNADYVGDNFAEEARKMHFKETEERGIYGEATVDEVKSLAEDGIDCLPMPVLPEDQN
ncbi:DUF1178 family protein [Cohaesibacter marisflavi]|uniref:DUF1178 family protein n=1 Tax=Cohaesibacter marisflavi TaxID=655353 RepID=UPI0029C6994C|nr:DUF1178 family protein [Cohaesibacter marisflavi]